MVVHSYNLRTLKTGRGEAFSHLWLQSDSKPNLCYQRPCLEKRNRKLSKELRSLFFKNGLVVCFRNTFSKNIKLFIKLVFLDYISVGISYEELFSCYFIKILLCLSDYLSMCGFVHTCLPWYTWGGQKTSCEN